MDNAGKNFAIHFDCVEFQNESAATWTSSALFNNDDNFNALKHLRAQLYPILGKRRDATMDLIDSLASQQTAQSVTDLSEQPQFVRSYASVTDAIHYASPEQENIKQFMVARALSSLPTLSLNQQDYLVIAADATPSPRAHAKCLDDRTIIYDSSNQVTGKPINIGHTYSAVVGITGDPLWVSPIALERVPSSDVAAQFGMKQVVDTCQKVSKQTIVLLDSGYNNAPCRDIARNANYKVAPIFIIRSACNRKYHIPAKNKSTKKGGAHTKYGEAIDLYKPFNGVKPDAAIKVTPSGNQGYIIVLLWKKTYTKLKGMKGYEDPSSLISIYEFRDDGSFKYDKPMVLRVFVPEHSKFNACHGAWLYFLRFTIERFFGTAKQRLLFGRFQSPEIKHQEAFSLMSALAYQQWFFSKMSGSIHWTMKPWHRYPKHKPKGHQLNPSNLQKGFSNVLFAVGTPSTFRTTTNKPHGRVIGQKQKARAKKPVIRKSQKNSSSVDLPKSDSESMNTDTRKKALEVAANCIKSIVKPLLPISTLLLLVIMVGVPAEGITFAYKEKRVSFNQNATVRAFDIPVDLSNTAVNHHFMLGRVLSRARPPPKIV